MQIKVSEISGLIAAVNEIQHNGGRMMGNDFFKGLPFKMDYDLGKINKALQTRIGEAIKEFTDFGIQKNIKFKNEKVGDKIMLAYDFPEGVTDEFKKEFKDLEEKIWMVPVELEIKPFTAAEFADVIFRDCPNKNIFFELLVTD